MDSSIGLDCIVENKDYAAKLGSALDTNNSQVKKQVFELLSALCVYNAEGYTRALEALQYYKTIKSTRYKFSLVLEELRAAKTDEYRTVLFAFINCLVISTPQLKDRNRLRNEFIGLKLLEVIRELKTKNKDPDLKVQLDVFEEQRDSDETHSQGPHDLDLSSHLDVFYTVYNRVQDTPQEIPFLSILQHLLRIDPKEPVSDIIWDTAETLVHRATLMESKEDSERLLRAPSQHKSLHRLKSMDGGLRPEFRKHSLENQLQQQQQQQQQGMAAPPPPPPPPPPAAGAPPPPPPPPMGAPPQPPPPPPGGGPPPPPPPPGGGPPPPPPPPGGGPPPPPPPPGMARGGPPPPPPGGGLAPPPPPQNIKMPQLETPKPKNKMKTFNWTKLPVNKIFGKNNIWTKVAKTFEKEKTQAIDFSDMEQLFCVQAPAPPPAEKGKEKDDKKKKESSEINLLDGKRSLNINIFLRQFRSSNEDILEMITSGDHCDFGPEKLRGLMKILPETDEIEMLKSWDGDYKKLGNAEKFIIQLIAVKNYKLRIECMLLKAEFESNMSFLEPAIETMLTAGEELLTSQKLQSLLYLLLVAGNFLNSGGYAGNAAGMKISSLHKLTDIRSNRPGMNLLHYVAGQIEVTQPELLTIVEDLAILEEATKTSIDSLNTDITKLGEQVKKIDTQMKAPNTQRDVIRQMEEFLPYASKELDCLKAAMADLSKMQLELSEFFCEDAKTFKMEECFKAFHSFINNFKKAIQENEKRREQERQADARRAQREADQVKRRSGSFAERAGKEGPGEANHGEDEAVINNLMHDIKEGFVQRRLPDGGFKPQYSPMVMRKFKKSLDSQMSQGSTVSAGSTKESEDDPPLTPVTPLTTPKLGRRGRGGSFSGPGTAEAEVAQSPGMRRRRSRVPSEEEDKLINYLVAGGHVASDGNRERNLSLGNIGDQGGYGSLDRGLIRRSRGRKRPELLTSDLERDRSAPQPSVEPEEKQDPKTKEIKRRVESWLKESEVDASKAEEYLDKKKAKAATRGSNSDLRNGKILGTLHEDKPLDAKAIVARTDVIKAMETVEGASLQEKPRKKTPPHAAQKDDDRKKALIRSLGRRPSNEKVSLYLRKASAEGESQAPDAIQLREKKGVDNSTKANKFLQDMARRSQEITTGFLDKIEEEKKGGSGADIQSSPNHSIDRKYPLNRITTPNSLREHLKETLAKNLGSRTDLAETIHAINDDEILDTFNIDNENIETPPIQRRAFRHRSLRLPAGGQEREEEEEQTPSASDATDFANRRRSNKFKTVGGDGRPLGDRELVIKKKKDSCNDLSEGNERRAATDLEEELGSGLFDRFSNARKTLSRSSMRRKKDGGEDSEPGDDTEKAKGDTWRSKLANRFKKTSDSYDLVEAEKGMELRNYLSQVTPSTEPTRRKNTSGSVKSDRDGLGFGGSRRGSTISLMASVGSGQARKDSRQSLQNGSRRTSYIQPGDYDSALVDGKYVTSVPIVSMEMDGEDEEDSGGKGNLRPGRTVQDKKSGKKSSIIDRLSSKGTASSMGGPTAGRTGNSVFDRLSTGAGGRHGSRTSLNGSRPSLAETRASNSSLAGGFGSGQQHNNRTSGTFTRIKDLSKDITKNLRKNKEESTNDARNGSVVRPRNSHALFSAGERRPMSSINGDRTPSATSSTRSLNRGSGSTGRDVVAASSRVSSLNQKNASLSSLSSAKKPGVTRPTTSRSTSLFSSDTRGSRTKGDDISGSSGRLANGTSTSRLATNTSSKENLSRSSSSASRSSANNNNSQQRAVGGGGSTTTTTRTGSTVISVGGGSGRARNSPLIHNSSSTSSLRGGSGSTTGLASGRSSGLSSSRGGSTSSFMKPTAASAKKVLSTGPAETARKPASRTTAASTTTSRVTQVTSKPSRR